jgi:hypothetical protein
MEPYAQIRDASPFAASADLFTILVEDLQSAEAAGAGRCSGSCCKITWTCGRRGRSRPSASTTSPPQVRTGSRGTGWRPATAGCWPRYSARCRSPGAPGGGQGSQSVPGRCRAVAAGLPPVPCPGPAGRGGSSARLVRGRARGNHPPLRAGDGQTAGRAGSGERCLRHRRVLRRPHPRAVHRLDAAGTLRRRQGDRDAAPGTAPGNRQSRGPAGPDADPADPRGETLPQADGHLGLRLRHRAITAPPARHHRPARRAARAPHAAAPAQDHGEMAGRIGAARPGYRRRRRLARPAGSGTAVRAAGLRG